MARSATFGWSTLPNRWSLRFIEQMPLEAVGTWDRSQMITAAEILQVLSTEFDLVPVPTQGSAPGPDRPPVLVLGDGAATPADRTWMAVAISRARS